MQLKTQLVHELMSTETCAYFFVLTVHMCYLTGFWWILQSQRMLGGPSVQQRHIYCISVGLLSLRPYIMWTSTSVWRNVHQSCHRHLSIYTWKYGPISWQSSQLHKRQTHSGGMDSTSEHAQPCGGSEWNKEESKILHTQLYIASWFFKYAEYYSLRRIDSYIPWWHPGSVWCRPWSTCRPDHSHCPPGTDGPGMDWTQYMSQSLQQTERAEISLYLHIYSSSVFMCLII